MTPNGQTRKEQAPYDPTDYIPGVNGPINADSHPFVYLSGPMTGYPEYNKAAFAECELELTIRGYKVFNPASPDRLPQPGEPCPPYEEYLRRDLRVLTSSKNRPDAIVILPGWQHSKGANLEVFIGQILGIDIVEIQSGAIVTDFVTAFHWLKDVGGPDVPTSERFVPPMIRPNCGEMVLYDAIEAAASTARTLESSSSAYACSNGVGIALDFYGQPLKVTAEELRAVADQLPAPVRSYKTVKPGDLATLPAITAARVDFSDLEFYDGISAGITPEPARVEVQKVQEVNALRQAERLIYGDRNLDYGHPIEDFTRSATMWGAILGCTVSPEQVGMCMVAVKMSRECNKHKEDNIVDMAGYVGCIDRIKRRQEGKE